MSKYLLFSLLFYHFIGVGNSYDSLMIDIQSEKNDSVKLQKITDAQVSLKYSQENRKLINMGLSLSNKLLERDTSIYVLRKNGYYHQALALVLINEGEFDSSFWSLDNARKAFGSRQDSFNLSFVYNDYARFNEALGRIDTAILYYDTALFWANKTNDHEALGILYANIGNIHSTNGSFEESLKSYHGAIDHYNQIDHSCVYLQNLYLNLGILFIRQNDYDEALIWFKKSDEYCDKFLYEPNYEKCSVWANLATCYWELNQIDSAKYYSNKSLELGYEYDYFDYLIVGLYVKGLISLDESNSNIKDVLVELETLLSDYDSDVYRSKYLELKIQHLIQQKNFDTGLRYSDTLLDLSYRIQNPTVRLQAILYKSDILHEKGAFQKALLFKEQYIVLKDSLQNKELTKQLESEQWKWRINNKEVEDSLALASERSAFRIQQLEKDNQIQNQKLLMLIGLIMAIIIIAFFVLRYWRIKLINQKDQAESKRQKLLLQDKLLRAQIEPHFISNTLLVIMNAIKNDDQAKAELYLQQFALLLRKILDATRKEKISIEDDVEINSHYLKFKQMLKPGAFDFNVRVDKNIDLEMMTIPPMMAQPFIENSLIHGLIDEMKGVIDIEYSLDGEQIRLRVKDNGKGIDKGSKDDTNRISHATSITRERLDLYSPGLKLTVQNSNVQNGVEVDIQLPFE
jgi:tetratricopeptide (TPR) repeat protein